MANVEVGPLSRRTHRLLSTEQPDTPQGLYDLIYAAAPSSDAYRAIVAQSTVGLPAWVIPLSSADRTLLERVAEEMRLHEGETFVDLACGLGGGALWIAQRTGTSVIGIDFSPVAVTYATALAANLRLMQQAQFYAREATRTELPGSSVAGLMSIDSLQFIEPGPVTKEIARILRPGARAVIETWEALTAMEVPTVVRDYRPYLEAAGLMIRKHAVIDGARSCELARHRLMTRCAEALRAEMGEAAAPLLQEAESALRREHAPPRVRKVFIVASMP